MYTKIIHGWVEQRYDENGVCTEQVFVASGEVSRVDENDDTIEDTELLSDIESRERLCLTELVQP